MPTVDAESAGRYLEFGGDTPARTRFQPVQQRTHCTYSPQSRLWGCPDWDAALSCDQNLTRMLPDFTLFLDLAYEFELDGYILEMHGSQYGCTVEQLARTLNRVLVFLSDRDPAGEHCLDLNVEDPAWAFSFGGERLFVNTFAPCYDTASSRYAFGCEATYVLFQPRHSFRRAFRPRETALLASTRGRIRGKFMQHGRGYDADISAAPFDAYRFVRPLRLGDPVVRWWAS